MRTLLHKEHQRAFAEGAVDNGVLRNQPELHKRRGDDGQVGQLVQDLPQQPAELPLDQLRAGAGLMLYDYTTIPSPIQVLWIRCESNSVAGVSPVPAISKLWIVVLL